MQGSIAIVGADVRTMDAAGTHAEAVLVRDGVIAAVGSSVDIARQADEAGIRILEVDGATVLPGFVDAHTHLELASYSLSRWPQAHTPPLESLTEVADVIRAHLRDNPGDDFVLVRSSFGMHAKVSEGRLFTRAELDEIEPVRPLGVASGLHVLSLNTSGMHELGIFDLPDGPERVIHRDADGAPSGVVTVADMVKIMVDGSDTTFIQQDELRAAILAADAAGFNMHFHSYADVSTTWILDGIEEAIRVNGPRRRRNHIAHLFVVAPHDYARFGELGVSANVQGLWAGSSVPHDHIHPSATPDPVAHEYPFGRMHAAGTPLAAGSDWPVTTPDPFLAARTAAGDYPVSDGYKEMSPTDRLDPVAMLTAFTTGSAYVNGRADRTGRVAPGFLADLAILDRDVIGDPAALAEVAVDETWIGGRRVFRRG